MTPPNSTSQPAEDPELAFRHDELAFRRDQLAFEQLKWNQQNHGRFRRWLLQWVDSPTRATISVALLTLAGGLLGLVLQFRANTQLERQKFESQIVLDAIARAPSNDIAALRLQFLLETGVLEDRTGKIRGALRNPNSIPVVSRVEGPATPAFNVHPISVTPRLEHDLPMIDVLVVGAEDRGGRFATTDAERAAGVQVNPGDTILVSIYLHNAAATASEYATADNVRVGVVLPNQSSTRQYVGAGVTADNARAVYTSDTARGGNSRIWATRPVRLRLIPSTTIACSGTRTFDERKSVIVGRDTPDCGYGFAELAINGSVSEALVLGRIRGGERVFISFLVAVETVE